MPLFEIQGDEIAEIAPSEELLERNLEDILVRSRLKPLYGEELLIVGRQISTDTDKRLDILAIDPEGRLVLVELKKEQAKREIISQIIDYASWLDKLSEHEVEMIFRDNNNKSLLEEFKRVYNREFKRNEEIVLFLLARSFDKDVLDAVNYLLEYGLPIVCIEYDIFGNDGDSIFLYTRQVAGRLHENIEKSPYKREDKIFFKQLSRILEENSVKLH